MPRSNPESNPEFRIRIPNPDFRIPDSGFESRIPDSNKQTNTQTHTHTHTQTNMHTHAHTHMRMFLYTCGCFLLHVLSYYCPSDRIDHIVFFYPHLHANSFWLLSHGWRRPTDPTTTVSACRAAIFPALGFRQFRAAGASLQMPSRSPCHPLSLRFCPSAARFWLLCAALFATGVLTWSALASCLPVALGERHDSARPEAACRRRE